MMMDIMVSRWTSVCPSARLSYVCPSLFVFQDDNLSKYQWFFTKLGMCIDIEEIWFGIANGQILSILTVICRHTSISSFSDDNQ